MADSEFVSPSRITGPQILEMRDHFWNLMGNTRNAATEARQHLAMKTGVTLPEGVQIAGAEHWVSRLPHQWTGPQRVLQNAIKRKWEIKRSVTSGGFGASSVATRLEQPLNAIMRDKVAGFPWDAANDLILNEGLAFSTVSLWTQDWAKTPSLYGADGKTLEKRFSQDAGGRLRGDDGYDEASVDLGMAEKAMRGELQDHQARNLPFRQRAYSIRSCAPIWGPHFELDGLFVKTFWTPQKLLASKFLCSTDKAGEQMYPLGALGEGDSSHGGKQIEVTEAWLYDEDRKPYVSYLVQGAKGPLYTWRKPGKNGDKMEPYVVDLSKLGPNKDKSLSRLPLSWGWGLGWPAADLDERAMTFVAPFLQSWRNIDSMLTSIIVWSMWRAFPSLIEEDPIGASAQGIDDEDEPNVPNIGFMKITKVRGKITEIGSQGIAAGVLPAISLMMGETKSESPGGESEGGASGFAMSLSAAHEANALGTVHDAVLDMAGMNASYVLEGAKLLGEAYEPIRVYQLSDVLIEQKKPSKSKQMMTLDPELVGDSFDVSAVSVKTPGENPAVRQQNAALVKEGFYDKRWFLEQDGYPAPEEMAHRVAWDAILDSEPGQTAQLRMLEQYVSDEFIKQITEQIQKGQANPQTGLPTGYADGTSPPPDMLAAGPQAAGMAGMGTPNPAAASLAGAVGGGMQTAPMQRSLNAGGVIPPEMMGAV